MLVVAATSILPGADHPKSWLGNISEDLNRLFGHRSILHSLLARALATATSGSLTWWIIASPAPMVAALVGYGSLLLADMMTLGGVPPQPWDPPRTSPKCAPPRCQK